MNNLNGHSIVEELKGVVGTPHLRTEDLAAYALNGLAPRCVVSPGCAAEVASILTLANREKLAVLPRGNGTKFSLGGIPSAGDLVLSLSRLNRIVDYDVPNLTITVEAGVTLDELSRVLAAQGNFLPLDAPFAEATVGGVVATNSSGPKRLLYGSARDLTLGVRAVTACGDVVRFGGKVMKNVAGYDMTKLLIGSFGSLGVITEVSFRLLPFPEMEKTLVVTFPSLEHAWKAVTAILASQLVPSAIELLNATGWQRVSNHGAGYQLTLNLEGFHEAVERQVADVRKLANKEGAQEVVTLEGDEQRRLWSSLRDFSRAAIANDGSVVGMKIGVPISALEELFRLAEQKAAESGLECAIMAHAGNGVLYPFFGDSAGRVPVLVQVVHDLQNAAVKAGGSAIVEWAPWAVKEQVAVWGEPRPEWSLMHRLKAELDPNGILNPGRLVGGI